MERSADYAIVVEPLSQEDGGGWLATVPALPGCIGDGETREEAVADAKSAIKEWLHANADLQNLRGIARGADGSGYRDRDDRF